MTDLIAELRKIRRVNMDAADNGPLPGESPEGNKQFHYGVAWAMGHAADLIEADPLYKAAKRLAEILRPLEPCDDDYTFTEIGQAIYDEVPEVRRILATLPKE